MTKIPTQAEYEADEARRFHRDLNRVEAADRAEKQAGAVDWFDLLGDVDEVVVRVDWLLAGNYGFGAQQAALKIAANKRSNRAAQIGQIIAALECQCPQDMARREFLRCSPPAQREINNRINAELDKPRED